MSEKEIIIEKYQLTQDEINNRRLRLYKQALEKYKRIQKGENPLERCGFCKEATLRNDEINKQNQDRNDDCYICLCNPDLCNDGIYPSLWDNYYESREYYFRSEDNDNKLERRKLRRKYKENLNTLIKAIKREIKKLE